MSEVIGGGAGTCASCRRPLAGRYCSACGEERIEPRELTVLHFLTRTLPAELFDYDGRWWRTLRALLLRPGFLTSEYWAGRRRAYVTPLKLLILAIVVYTLLTQGGLRLTWSLNGFALNMAPVATTEGASVETTVRRIDRFGLLTPMVAARAEDLRGDDARRDFHRRLERFVQPLSFTNVFLLALVLFWRSDRLLVQHGTFAMHYVAFVLLSAAIVGRSAIELLQRGALVPALLLNVAVYLVQMVYLVAAVHRFYLSGRRRWVVSAAIAAAVAIVLFVANGVFLTAVQTLGAAMALWLA